MIDTLRSMGVGGVEFLAGIYLALPPAEIDKHLERYVSDRFGGNVPEFINAIKERRDSVRTEVITFYGRRVLGL